MRLVQAFMRSVSCKTRGRFRASVVLAGGMLVAGEAEGVTQEIHFSVGFPEPCCFPVPGKTLPLQLGSFGGCGEEQTCRRIPGTVLGGAACFLFSYKNKLINHRRDFLFFRKHIDFLISDECVMGWNLHSPVPALPV